MNCLIVDDEHLSRKLLRTYLDRLPNMTVAGDCENATQALAFLHKHPVDLLLLDIQMPDLTGLELLKTLHRPPMVILITAYAEHALEGYELNVIDYLLKPVSFERFVQAVNKAAEQYQLRQSAQSPAPPTPQPSAPAPTKDHFFVKVDYKWLKIRYEDILYIEGMREYVNIQTHERRHIVYQSMKYLEGLLAERSFARTHKSYIVALNKIESLYGNTLVIGKQEIPIGKSYKQAFLERIETL